MERIREDAQGYFSTSFQPTDPRIRKTLWGIVGVSYLILGMLILTFDRLVPVGDTVRFAVGDIPDEDIFAPETRTYESAVLTEQARQEARQNIAPVYDRLSDVARDQVELTRDIIAYMSLVQNDPYAAPEQKLSDLQAIQALPTVDGSVWMELLNASSFRWTSITNEVVGVLQRVMRLDIRPDGVAEVRRTLANSVDPSFSDADQRIIIAIASDLIVPNSALNAERTQEAQNQAAAAVQPRFRTFEQGETVITKGKRITAVDIEALRQFGLLESGQSDLRVFFSAFLMLIIVSAGQLFYVIRFYPYVVHSTRLMIVLPSLFLIFLAGALIFGPEGFDQQKVYPAAALALLVTALIGPHMALLMVAALGLLVGVMFDNSLQLALLITVGGLAGVLALRDIERLNSYFTAGMYIGFANMVVVIASLTNTPDTLGAFEILRDATISFGNGLLAAALALVGLYVIGATANLTTSVKLIELMQPNQPLLQLLLRKAPGTYQHSLQVANLAELAAERIGANATLIRVAAMYHDIGTTLNPQFFVENQAEGINPHEELKDPYRSAQLIIGHVIEGERLARRYRLPQRIRDFIREHHGTSKPLYFYYRAIENANGDESKVDAAAFTYPGPRPQSKETAILLLADGTESTARAVRPRNHEAVAEVVNNTLQKALADGQLDESHLTLNDLKIIREVFVETLQAIYHSRIDYKKPDRVDAPISPPQLQSTTTPPPAATAPSKRDTTDMPREHQPREHQSSQSRDSQRPRTTGQHPQVASSGDTPERRPDSKPRRPDAPPKTDTQPKKPPMPPAPTTQADVPPNKDDVQDDF